MSDIPLTRPEVEARPGGHLFHWEAAQINIRLERLREHHDSVTAEFWATQGKENAHLLGGLRFNLVTPTGRNSIVNALKSRCNGVDWGGMVEQVCIYTLGKYREQEGLSHIGDMSHDTELRFLLEPLLPLGVTTLFFGYGDLGKTTLVYCLGLLCQSGTPALNLLPTQANVLLLDWETNREIADKSLQALHAGMELPGAPRFAYRRCRRPLTEFVEDVRADVERDNIGLVIVDSFTKACGGERETKENALPTLNAIDSLERTAAVITHRPKGEDGRSKGAYGSVYVENDVRQAFRVEGERSEDSATIGLVHHKHNLMSPLQPIGYKVTWDKLFGTTIALHDAQSIEGVVKRLSVNKEILSLLTDGPLAVVDLISAIGRAKQKQIRTRLTELKQAGVIVLLEDKRWALRSEYDAPKA